MKIGGRADEFGIGRDGQDALHAFEIRRAHVLDALDQSLLVYPFQHGGIAEWRGYGGGRHGASPSCVRAPLRAASRSLLFVGISPFGHMHLTYGGQGVSSDGGRSSPPGPLPDDGEGGDLWQAKWH